MAAELTSKEVIDTKEPNVFNLIHFSDLYDIHGGPSRFLSALNIFKNEKLDPLIFFSGNLLSGSNTDISCITKGQHMIDIINKFGITCGILGNHDLDFGENHLYQIIKQLKIPIINTNLLFKSLPNEDNYDTNNPLIRKYFIINYQNQNGIKSLKISDNKNIESEQKDEDTKSDHVHEDKPRPKTKKRKARKSKGLKIGVIGVSENWINTDRLDDAQSIIYQDMVECTKEYILELRKQHKVDMIIALTHNKLLNDRVLADNVNGIDLILGGHDHINTVEMIKNTRTLIVKSGYNFNNFSWIQFMKPPQSKEKKKKHKIDIIDNQHSQSLDLSIFLYIHLCISLCCFCCFCCGSKM